MPFKFPAFWSLAKLYHEPLSEAETITATRTRAYFLWVDAGRPLERDAAEFWQQAQQEIANGNCYIYKRKGTVFVYGKDGSMNKKDALSFVKDWVTSLIQLELVPSRF